ncbi:hypothetical protein [Mycobacteroides abscessus]|uniref:hypothetical protein n=1 Tax=Mycobacteroides abscessus TaxID=36809 RepID=UPI0012FFDF83
MRILSEITITPLGDLIRMGVDGDIDARNEFERRWDMPFQFVLDFAEEVKGSRGKAKETDREIAEGEKGKEILQS